MAVSILAELVALRSVAPRVAQVGSEAGAACHGGPGVGSASGAGSAEVTDPVCGMMVIPARGRFWGFPLAASATGSARPGVRPPSAESPTAT